MDPYELAVALTHIEGDLLKTIRWVDYLRFIQHTPSRLDAVLSTHHNIIRWAKYSMLRHDKIQDRATAIKRLAKTAQVRFSNVQVPMAIKFPPGVSEVEKLQFDGRHRERAGLEIDDDRHSSDDGECVEEDHGIR